MKKSQAWWLELNWNIIGLWDNGNGLGGRRGVVKAGLGCCWWRDIWSILDCLGRVVGVQQLGVTSRGSEPQGTVPSFICWGAAFGAHELGTLSLVWRGCTPGAHELGKVSLACRGKPQVFSLDCRGNVFGIHEAGEASLIWRGRLPTVHELCVASLCLVRPPEVHSLSGAWRGNVLGAHELGIVSLDCLGSRSLISFDLGSTWLCRCKELEIDTDLWLPDIPRTPLKRNNLMK